MSGVVLSTLATILFLAADNRTFWSKGLEIFNGHPVQFVLFGAAIFALTLAIVLLFGSRWSLKPFLVFIIILASITSYYVDSFGVLVDREMIQNVVTTTVAESRHLITAGLVFHVLAFGVLPAAVVLWVRVEKQAFFRRLWTHAGAVALCLSVFVALTLVNFKAYSSIVREHRDLMGSYQPFAPIVGAVRYARMVGQSRDVEVASLGIDASQGPALEAAAKPVLLVVVVGETARSQNFSLNGYARATNPELARRDVVSFRDVESCGTATAVSLPCMFSKFDRGSYSYGRGISTENLLDVLHHAGVAVEWWDNNTGDKGIASRLLSRPLTHSDNTVFCSTGECDDGIFLETLRNAVAGITQHTVLVLHQIGSHGPAYYLRYPPAFEVFRPDCRTAEFADCTPEEITNAYDDTIVYTDFVLAQTIDFLAAQDGLISALLYVSDHGESLGENGLYLHGAPYWLAPETQTRVPMIFWMSPAYQAAFGVDAACLRSAAATPISHANLFHSVLGSLDIRTREYRPELDVFAACRVADAALNAPTSQRLAPGPGHEGQRPLPEQTSPPQAMTERDPPGLRP